RSAWGARASRGCRVRPAEPVRQGETAAPGSAVAARTSLNDNVGPVLSFQLRSRRPRWTVTVVRTTAPATLLSSGGARSQASAEVIAPNHPNRPTWDP